MPNYYTQFCFGLRLPSAEAVEHALALAKLIDQHVGATEKEARAAGIPAEFFEYMEGGWSILVESAFIDGRWITEHPSIYISSDEDGNTNAAAALVQYLLVKYDLPATGFEYACTASRQVVDAYGGGAVWITKKDVEYMNSGHWLSAKQQASRRRKRKKK